MGRGTFIDNMYTMHPSGHLVGDWRRKLHLPLK